MPEVIEGVPELNADGVTTSQLAPTFERVLVVGAGTMGAGIAQVIAQSGIRAALCDADPGNLERGFDAIATRWDKLLDSGRRSREEVAQFGSQLRPGAIEDAADSDLVIEAIVEKLEPKSKLLQVLGAIAPAATCFASNTSSISITALGRASGRPDRFVGLHFFNPVPVLPLVEVIRGIDTSSETVDAAITFIVSIGKTPIVMSDSPGFVANRILLPMINEAIFTLQDGVAPKESIDEVMRLGMSHPIGPLALADLIGLDICLEVLETLHRDLGDDKYRPAPLLRRMVASGRLGRKSGEGFYTY